MTLYLNDTTPNDGLRTVYTLTANLYEGVVLSGNVALNMNGFGIIGTGSNLNSVGVIGQGGNNQVYSGYFSGWGSAVWMDGGQNGVGGIHVVNALAHGVTTMGGNNSVHNSVIHDIGKAGYSFYGATTGIVMGGANNFCAGNDIWSIAGTYETVGLLFTGTTEVYDVKVELGSGWSFAAYWGGGAGSTLSIIGSEFTGYTHGILAGNVGDVEIDDSIIEAEYDLINTDFDDLGGNYFFEPDPYETPYIYGTSGADQISADESGNTIVGMGGADTIYSGLGNDTFVFSLNALSIAPDFQQGADKIYLAYSYAQDLQFGTVATGLSAVALWDASKHVLMVDEDGTGNGAAQYVAYLPYVNSLTEADFLGL